jgi:hypothetical protein
MEICGAPISGGNSSRGRCDAGGIDLEAMFGWRVVALVVGQKRRMTETIRRGCAQASAPRKKRSRRRPVQMLCPCQEKDRTLTQHAEPDSMALEGTVAFTGRLASIRRADAFALVRTHGGEPREGVTKRTDVLIVGEFGWPLLDDGRPSNSLARAKSYHVLIASERQFLQWLGKSAPEEQAKTYSADQLASLSKLPKEIVGRLSMFGLIEARNGLYGFHDLAAARPPANSLHAMSPDFIVEALTNGIMKAQGSSLSPEQRASLAEYLTGQKLGAQARTDFEAELVIQSWDTAHSPESRRSRVKARDKW